MGRERFHEMVEDYRSASLRHFADADVLAANSRFDGAGHLVGFAAECAIKHAFTFSTDGLGAPRLHIPGLVQVARKRLRGLQHKRMYDVLGLASFFDGWTVDSRYSSDHAISQQEFTNWRIHASRVIGAAGLRGKS